MCVSNLQQRLYSFWCLVNELPFFLDNIKLKQWKGLRTHNCVCIFFWMNGMNIKWAVEMNSLAQRNCSNSKTSKKFDCWPHVKLRINKSYYCCRRTFQGMFAIVNDLMCLSFEQTSQMSRLMLFLCLFVCSRFSPFWTECVCVCMFVYLFACAYVVLFDFIQDNNVC